MEEKLVLLTGVTGKSGRRFIEKLAAEKADGMRFRAIVRPTSDTRALDGCGMEIQRRVGDLQDEAFLREAMEGASIVLHITNIAYSKNIVKTALDADVERLILVHTTGIYSRYKSASSGYLEIEKEIDEMLQKSGRKITLTILRPTMVYGSLHDGNVSVFIRMVDRLRFFPVVNGARYLLQPVHEKDLGEAYYRVLMNPEATAEPQYNLSGGEPVELIEMLRAIGEELQRKNRFVSVPYGLAYFAACVLYLFSGKKKDYRERVQRLVEPRAYSHEEATRDFGYRPMSFREGVKEEVAAYLRQKQGSEPEGL